MFDTSSWSSHSLVMHTNILACEPFSTCVWRVCGGRCLLQQTLEAAGRICQISLTTDRRVIVDQSYKSIATRPECSSYWRLFPRSAVKLKWKHMCVCECVWVSVCVCECGVWRVFLCFMTGSNCIYCSVMSEAEKRCSNMTRLLQSFVLLLILTKLFLFQHCQSFERVVSYPQSPAGYLWCVSVTEAIDSQKWCTVSKRS